MQSPRSGMFHPFPRMAADEDRQRMVTLRSGYRPRDPLTHESFKKAVPWPPAPPQRVAAAQVKPVPAKPPVCGAMER